MEVSEVLQLLDLATRLTKRVAILMLSVQREIHSYATGDHLVTISEIGRLTEALQKQTNLSQLSSDTFNLGDGIISRLEAEKRRRYLGTLPIELRQRILGMAINVVAGPGSALAFSHVNRQWRDMVVSAPSLWSDLHIPEPRLVSEDILKLYMERSMNAPLSIILHFGGGSYHGPSLFNTLVSHISRWHHVRLTMRLSNPLEAVVKAIAGKTAPILHTFKFFYYETYWPHLDEERPLHCPKLRHLSAPANLSPPSGPQLIAPALLYAHITRFTPLHLPRLNHYQNIDTLALDFIFNDTTRNSFDINSISLPRLKFLSIYSRHDSLKDIIPLLSHVQLPNLTKISLILHTKGGYIDNAELPAISSPFLQLPSLETCRLKNGDSSDLSEAVYLFLDQFMRQLTTLSELIVENGASFDLNRLLSAFQDEGYLPRLSRLRLGGTLTLGIVKPVFDQWPRLAGLEQVGFTSGGIPYEDLKALHHVVPNIYVY